MILDIRWKPLDNGERILQKYICDSLEQDDQGNIIVNRNGRWEDVTDAEGLSSVIKG